MLAWHSDFSTLKKKKKSNHHKGKKIIQNGFQIFKKEINKYIKWKDKSNLFFTHHPAATGSIHLYFAPHPQSSIPFLIDMRVF